MSYKQILNIARGAHSRCRNVDAKMLLAALPRYVEKHIFKNLEGESVKNAIHKKAVNSPARRAALDLIAKNFFLPNLRGLIYEYLIKELQEEHPGAYVEWHHPIKTPYPHEFNISLPGLYQGDFGVYYQLLADENFASITIQIMAWCGKKDSYTRSQKYTRYAEKMKTAAKLPKSEGVVKQWGCWKCVWAGPAYKIRDAEIKDIESDGLKKLVLDVMDKTYKPVVGYLLKHKI
jgi:hypothetical protein